VHHTRVLKPTEAWKLGSESRISSGTCGETAAWDVRHAAAKRSFALFSPILQFRKVCIMRLSPFWGSLQDGKDRVSEFSNACECFRIRGSSHCGRVAQLGEHLLCKRVRTFQTLRPLLRFLMFPTLSGNLLLARSKPRRLNYIGFWYGKSTAGFGRH
jgi:hypothetical protein